MDNNQHDFIESNNPNHLNLEQDILKLSNTAAQLIIDIDELEKNSSEVTVALASMHLHDFDESLTSQYDYLNGEDPNKKHFTELVVYIKELVERKKELIQKKQEIDAYYQYIQQCKTIINKCFDSTVVSHYLNKIKSQSLDLQEQFLITFINLIDKKSDKRSRKGAEKSFAEFYDKKTNIHLLEQLAFSCGIRAERPTPLDSEMNILGHRWKFLTKIIELFPPLPEEYVKTVIDRKLTTENEFFKDFYQSSHLEKFLVFFTKLSSHIKLSEASNGVLKNAVIEFLKKNPTQSVSALEPILQNLTQSLTEISRLEKRLDNIKASLERQQDPQAQIFLTGLFEKRQKELENKKNQASLLLNNMKLCFDSSILLPYSCNEKTLNLLAECLNNHIEDRELVSDCRKTILSIAAHANSFEPSQETNWSTTQIYALRSLASNLVFEQGPWTTSQEALLSKICSIGQRSQSLILQNFLTDLANYQSRPIRLDDIEHRKYLYFTLKALELTGAASDTQRLARLMVACCDQNQSLTPIQLIELYRDIKSDIGCRDEDFPEAILLILRKFQEKNSLTGKNFSEYYHIIGPEERANLVPALLDQTAVTSFEDFHHVYTSLTPEEYLEHVALNSSLASLYPFLKIHQNQDNFANFMAIEMISPLEEETHLWLRESTQSHLSEKAIALYQSMLASDEISEDQKSFLHIYFMKRAFIDIHIQNPPRTNCDLEEPIYSVVQKIMQQKDASPEHLMGHLYALRSYMNDTQRKEIQEACGLWAQHIQYKIDALNAPLSLKVIFDANSTTQDYEKAKLALLQGDAKYPYFQNSGQSLELFCNYLSETTNPQSQHNIFLFESYLKILENSVISLDAEKAGILQRTFEALLKKSPNPVLLKSQTLIQLHKISHSNPAILDSLHPLLDSIFKDDKKYSEKIFQTFFKDSSALRDYEKKVTPIFMALPEEAGVLSFAKREFISHLMRGGKSHISAPTLLTLIKNVYSGTTHDEEYHREHIDAYRNIIRQNVPTKTVAEKIKYIKSFVFDPSISDTMRDQIFEGSSLAAGLVELLVKDKASDFEKIIELQKIITGLQSKSEVLGSYYGKVKSTALGSSTLSDLPQKVVLEFNKLLQQRTQDYIAHHKETQSAYILNQKQQECARAHQTLEATWDSVLELELPDFLRYAPLARSGQSVEQSKLPAYLSSCIKLYEDKAQLDIQEHLQSLSLQQFYLIFDDIRKSESCPAKLKTTSLDRSDIQRDLLVGQISSYTLTEPFFQEETAVILEHHRQKNLQLLLDEVTKLTSEKILSPTQSLEILCAFDKSFDTSSLKRMIEKKYLSESEMTLSQNQLINLIEKEIVYLQSHDITEPYRSFWAGLIIDKISFLHEHKQLSPQVCEQYLNNLPSNIEDINVIRSRIFFAELLHRNMVPTDKLYERLLDQVTLLNKEESLLQYSSLFELQYILGRLKGYPFIEKLISRQNTAADFSDRAQVIVATIESYTLESTQFKQEMHELEKELREYKLKNLYDDVISHSKISTFNIAQQFKLFDAFPEKYCTEELAVILNKSYQQEISKQLSIKIKDINLLLQKESIDIINSGVTEPFISLWVELFITKLALFQEKGLLSEQSHYAFLKSLPLNLESEISAKIKIQLLETARSLFLTDVDSSPYFISEIQKLYTECGYHSNFAEYLLERSEATEKSSQPLLMLHQVMLTSLEAPESLYHVSQSAALVHIKDFYPQKTLTDGLIALKKDIEKLKIIYESDSQLAPVIKDRLFSLEESVSQLAALYPHAPTGAPTTPATSSKKLFGNGLASPSQKTKEALDKLKKDIIERHDLATHIDYVFDFIELTLSDLQPSQKTQLTTMMKASLAFEILEKIVHDGSITRRNLSLEIILNHNSMSSLTSEQIQTLQDRAEIYKNTAKEKKARSLSRGEKETYLEEVSQEIKSRLKAVDMIFKMQSGNYNSQEHQAQKDVLDVAEYFHFESLSPSMLTQKINKHLSRAPHDRVYDITDTLMTFNSREILIDEQHRQNIRKNKMIYLDGLPALFSLDTFLTDFLERRDFQKDLDILRGECANFTQEGDQQIPYLAMLHYHEEAQRQKFFENVRKALPLSDLACLKPIVMIYDIDKNFSSIDKSEQVNDLLDAFNILIHGTNFPAKEIDFFEKSIHTVELPITSNTIIQLLNKCSFFNSDEHEELKANIAKSLSMQSIKSYKEYLQNYPVLDKESRELLRNLISQYELDDFEKGRAIKLPILAARYAQKNPNSAFAQAWNESFTRLYVETSSSKELAGLSFQASANILARIQSQETNKVPLADRLYHNHPWIQTIAFSLPQKFDSSRTPAWVSSVISVIKTSYANMYSFLANAASLVKKMSNKDYFSSTSPKEIQEHINNTYEKLDMLFDIFENSNKVAKKIALIHSPNDLVSRDHEAYSKQEFLALNYEMAAILAHLQNSIGLSGVTNQNEKTTLQDEIKIKAVLDSTIENLSNPEYLLKILRASEPRIIEKTITNAANQQVVITQKIANNDLLQGLHASLTQLIGMNSQLYSEYQPVLNDLLGNIIVACQSFSDQNNLTLDLSYFQEPYLEFWQKSLESCDGSARAPRFPSQESCVQLQQLYSIIMKSKGNDAEKAFFTQQAEYFYNKLMSEIASCLNSLSKKHPLNQNAIIKELKETLQGLVLNQERTTSLKPNHAQLVALQQINAQQIQLDSESQLLLNLLSLTPQSITQLCASYIKSWVEIVADYRPSESLYLSHARVQALLKADSYIRESLESSQLTSEQLSAHTNAITEANRQYNEALRKIILLCCEHDSNIKVLKKNLAALDDLLAIASTSSSFVIEEYNTISITKNLRSVLDQTNLPMDELMADSPYLVGQINTQIGPEQILSHLNFLVKGLKDATSFSEKEVYTSQLKESLVELLSLDLAKLEKLPELLSLLKEQIPISSLDNEMKVLISMNLCLLDSAENLYVATSNYLRLWAEQYQQIEGQEFNAATINIILTAHEKLEYFLAAFPLTNTDQAHLRSVLNDANEHYNECIHQIVQKCSIGDSSTSINTIQEQLAQLNDLLGMSKNSEFLSMKLVNFDILKATLDDICKHFEISFENVVQDMPFLAQEFIAKNQSSSIKYEESPTGVDQFPDSDSLTSGARHALHKSPKLKD